MTIADSHTQTTPLSYIRELSIALEHTWVPERAFVIFTAYFDESGSHAGSPTLVMAAFLAHARQLELFERRLRGIQTGFGFTIFHAKDFRARAGEFRGWPDDKRAALLVEMVKLLETQLEHGVSVTLDKDRYEREFREQAKAKRVIVDSQYGTCFRHLMSYLIRHLQAGGRRHRLNAILEVGHENVGDACRIFEEVKDEIAPNPDWPLLGSVTIGKKASCPPLMAADFLAYLTLVENRDSPTPLREHDGTEMRQRQQPTLTWQRMSLTPSAYDLRLEQIEEGKRRKSRRG